MSNEEYTFSEKKRVIEEILMPFFQQQTPDTSHVDYILVLKECILKFDVFKNSVFETLGISFIYDETLIQPQIEARITSLQDINSLSIILNEAFSYFSGSGQFSQLMSTATVTFLLQQNVLIPVDDNVTLNEKFYDKIKELISDVNLKLSIDDFAYINSLSIYYILKYMADCTFFQLTLPNGVLVPLNVSSDAPMQLDTTKEEEERKKKILEENVQLFSDDLKNFSSMGSFAQMKMLELSLLYNFTTPSAVINTNNIYNI